MYIMAYEKTMQPTHENKSFFKIEATNTPEVTTPTAKALGPCSQHTREVVDKSVVIQSLKIEKTRKLEDAMGSMGQPPRALSSLLFYV